MKRIIIILFVFIWVKGIAQQPIFIDGQNLIYSVNINNCTKRLVGSGTQAYGDIAFTPDGNLWGIANGGIYQIDTSNANSILIGYTQTGGVSLVALNDSVLLSEFKDSLWAININTLKKYNLGDIGYPASGDLTWYDNDLYMSAGLLLIKIVLNTSNTAIISSEPVNSFTINPLPPDCEGLATASFPGLENSIIGFSTANTNVYKICPIDGSSQLLCPLMGQFAGAASIRLPTQNPLPTSCAKILPVNLLNFTSTILPNAVKLQWQTASEINSSYFLIERSVDGINFSTIGKVNAAGSSNILKQYSFVDNAPLGENYYRLKEVDLNGNYTFSNILSVKMPQANALNIIQNPVQNNLQFTIDNLQSSTNYLSIFDFTGRRVNSFTAQNGVQDIDVSFLTSGTYVLQMITADGQVYDKVFVKGK
jgi:hypothetical protein